MARRLFWFIVIFLAFGLVVLSSASVALSENQFGNSSHYWKHQLMWGVLPGIVLMLVIWKAIPYKLWRKLAFPILFLALGLLVLVLIPGFGIRLKGATSWISLFGASFQPAEFLKFALVIYLAAWLSESTKRLKSWQLGLLPFAIIMGIIGTLLLLQPDLGTLGIIFVMAGGVYFIAGAPLKQAGVIVAAILIIVVAVAALSPERWSRITTVFNPTADSRGSGWQLNQALIAIGAGGMWGVGLGESTQKFGFLPEPIGDSVFAVLTEELGFVGGAATIGLFAILSLMLMRVARRAPDAFGSLVASGMMLWIMTQAIVNMAAITGLGPLTGIPLPFISYGGTAMMMMLAGLGIVLNVAEHSE
jgi:cell division protein FtsW